MPEIFSTKLQTVSVKTEPGLSEKWIQDQIIEDPSILGLGELEFKAKEKTQPTGGRLDLLLQEPESLKRYELELQLGATDETHIIRTIEYWDIERKRYPQYEHAAVIVAEEITGRFLNVIHLFNGSIPLIALKMTVYKVGEAYALTFVRVLDEMSYGREEEDDAAAEVTDRSYWERKGTKDTLILTDKLHEYIRQLEPSIVLRYNKHYIGLGINGVPVNFVDFVPKKGHVIVNFKIEKSEEVDNLLENSELDKLKYDAYWKRYRIKFSCAPTPTQIGPLMDMIKRARDAYKGMPLKNSISSIN